MSAYGLNTHSAAATVLALLSTYPRVVCGRGVESKRGGRGRRTAGRWGNSSGGARREVSGCATSPPLHVAAYIRAHPGSVPTVKQHLAAIDTGSLAGARDRALFSVMLYSFARVSAVLGMRRQDYFGQGSRGWLRLHEKSGKRHDVTAHHRAAAALDAYIEAGELEEPKAALFQTLDPAGRRLTGRAIERRVVLAMIKRRAAAAGLPPSTCCHTFRATGVTAYLSNGGTLEHAQQIAGHASPKTTKLYDRTADTVTVDEIDVSSPGPRSARRGVCRPRNTRCSRGGRRRVRGADGRRRRTPRAARAPGFRRRPRRRADRRGRARRRSSDGGLQAVRNRRGRDRPRRRAGRPPDRGGPARGPDDQDAREAPGGSSPPRRHQPALERPRHESQLAMRGGAQPVEQFSIQPRPTHGFSVHVWMDFARSAASLRTAVESERRPTPHADRSLRIPADNCWHPDRRTRTRRRPFGPVPQECRSCRQASPDLTRRTP